jgi:hypothetical protein
MPECQNAIYELVRHCIFYGCLLRPSRTPEFRHQDQTGIAQL